MNAADPTQFFVDIFGRIGRLLQNGVPLVPALDAVFSEFPSAAAQTIFKTLCRGIEQGKSLTEALRSMNLLPDPVLAIILAGEEQGKLDETLIRLSDMLFQGDFSLPELNWDALPLTIEETPEPSIASRVNKLIIDAVQARASDLHIEPDRSGGSRIRLRIDGVLHQQPEIISSSEHIAIISRLKVMSNLDVGERKLPQDGRILMRSAETGGDARTMDIRVSICPYAQGEKAVLRILETAKFPNSLSAIGLPEDRQQTLMSWLNSPHGLILVSGPTGSGKTTTLYLMLSEIAKSGGNNVLSIEDPVEYLLPGVQQMQVQPSIGLTFSAGIRSMLRQDPDVICIGEVQDAETARLAIQVALTGHLVLTQLHAPTAASAIKLLADLGTPAFKLKESIIGAASQRLVRKLCSQCKEVLTASSRELLPAALAAHDGALFGPKGCPNCHGTGYRGRALILESLSPRPEFWKALAEGASIEALEALLPQDHPSMLEHGIRLVKEGITSPSEIVRVLG